MLPDRQGPRVQVQDRCLEKTLAVRREGCLAGDRALKATDVKHAFPRPIFVHPGQGDDAHGLGFKTFGQRCVTVDISLLP